MWGAAGLFTSTDPELRRVRPKDVRGRQLIRVVYVLLEAQYQASLTAAVQTINNGRDDICFEVSSAHGTHSSNILLAKDSQPGNSLR